MVTKFNDELVERLLYEAEGDALDFKGEQYKFIKASDDEKSELLKDIIAFSNSWRRADAFILVGVREVKGGRSIVVGISEQIDDAAIQQFVNSKMNRPINFSYRTMQFEQKTIAIIHLPLQKGPFFLKKDFGILKENAVYIKRGSSTDIARPDEISNMGSQIPTNISPPNLEVFFADISSRIRLESPQRIYSVTVIGPKDSEIPDYSSSQHAFVNYLTRDNENYYRDLIKCVSFSEFTTAINFGIHNIGDVSVTNVKAEIKCNRKNGNVFVFDRDDIPEPPNMIRDITANFHRHFKNTLDIHVQEVGQDWIAETTLDRLHSKDTHWFKDGIYVGSLENCTLELDVTLFSEEIIDPIRQKLLLEIESKTINATLDEIDKMQYNKFLASPEGKKFLLEYGLQINQEDDQ